MNESWDFVVVGSGGGSMCAGLAMRESGKSVLILEKTSLVGGSTATAGGMMWIPNNCFMREAGLEDSFEDADTYLDHTVGMSHDAPGATPARRATYVRRSAEMVDFLVSQGIKLTRWKHWPDYYDERPGAHLAGRQVMAEMFDASVLGPWRTKLRANKIPVPAPMEDLFEITLFKRSWHGKLLMLKTALRIAVAKVTGTKWVVAGAALQGRMLEAALREKVEIRLDAAVKELILEDGAVTGVTVIQDGKPVRIAARLGVLLNAGGFAHNQQMRDVYMPGTRAEWTHAAEGDTGDLHAEMIRIGVQMGQMDEMIGNQMTLPPESETQVIQMQLAKPHAFLVDQSGVRYMNECGSYMEFCQTMMKRDKTIPAVPSWMIMDSRFLKDYMLAQTMPGLRKPRSWFDTNFLRQGETIEDLARACNIDADTLAATTLRFNRSVRTGVDEEFGRGNRAYDRFLGDHTHGPSPTLGTVEEGPFFAVPVVPGDVGTYGGVVTDCDARVLREDGSVIPGLYATGTTTASVMGRVYPGSGSSIGPSFTWGYVAARHALASQDS